MFKYAEQLSDGLEIISDSIVKKTACFSNINSLNQTRKLIKHFINHPDPMVVPVYSWKERPKNKNGLISYSYTMKRLCLLSQEERHVISLCCASLKKDEDWNHSYIEKAKNDLFAFNKDYSLLISFIEEAILNKNYVDTHKGNFLKDEYGDYKIIDLEGFLYYPWDHRDLSWISKED